MAPALRFDRNARYGAAMVGVLFAAFLNIATDFSAFLQAANYAGALGTDVPAVDFVEYLIILGLYVASFTMMPTTGARRLGAVTLACVVLLLWATVGIERGIGNIDQPVAFWTFVVNQGLITLVVALGGWLLVRGRHPLAFVVLLLAIIPPIVSRILVECRGDVGRVHARHRGDGGGVRDRRRVAGRADRPLGAGGGSGQRARESRGRARISPTRRPISRCGASPEARRCRRGSRTGPCCA